MPEFFDYIIVGTGAGGGTLVHKLKDSGKKILVLERGEFLKREPENWDTRSVFKEQRYHTHEVWKTDQDKDFHPQTGYFVGGNTKVYGAALFRLREKDFEELVHHDGISPKWPLSYADFESYYTEAEKLYFVHGKQGDDITEPHRSQDYFFPPVSHEPRIQELHDKLKAYGLHPFCLPIGINLNEKDPVNSPCIRCNTCDGFPCLVEAKADADMIGIRPNMNNSSIQLITGAKVTRLLTDESGTKVIAVEVERNGALEQYHGDKIVLSAGAINSAAILLRSVTDKHLNGLGNSSGLVGKNLMKHNNAAMLAISTKYNPTKFQKTMALNDFYFGDEDFHFPMGHVQLLGKSNKEMLTEDAPFFTPGLVLEEMASHSVDWWFTGEDLPDPNNGIEIIQDTIHIHYTPNNRTGFERLMDKWKHILNQVDENAHLIPHGVYLGKIIGNEGLAHQVGTLRFGTDPKTSVLDTNCKLHDVDNVYVVDGSFFPSSGAVNPSLTIIANALRIGDYFLKQASQ